jgi:hypothetical protein
VQTCTERAKKRDLRGGVGVGCRKGKGEARIARERVFN